MLTGTMACPLPFDPSRDTSSVYEPGRRNQTWPDQRFVPPAARSQETGNGEPSRPACHCTEVKDTEATSPSRIWTLTSAAPGKAAGGPTPTQSQYPPPAPSKQTFSPPIAP